MKKISLVLYAVAIFFCIWGFTGHSEAWPAAASIFVAATVFMTLQQKKK